MTDEIEREEVDDEQRERKQSSRKLKQKLRRDNELNDIQQVMGTSAGRRFVWRLLDRAGIHRLSFTGDPLTTAFAEGGRNIGLFVMAETEEACPELCAVMKKEARGGNGEDS